MIIRSLLTKFLLLFTMIGVVGVVNLAALVYFEDTIKENAAATDVIEQLILCVQNMNFYAQEIMEGKEEYKETMKTEVAKYDAGLEALISGGTINGRQLEFPPEEVRGYIDTHKQLWKEFREKAILLTTTEAGRAELQAEDAEAMHQEGEHLEAGNTELRDAFVFVQDKTNELVAINNKIRDVYVGLDTYYWQLGHQLTVVFVGASAAIFSVAVWYTRKFIHPIKLLTSTMDRIKAGQYETKDSVQVSTSDEVGVLAESFCMMMDTIQSKTKELKIKNEVLEELTQNLTFKAAELRVQAAKLQAVDLAKEEFASMIIHELKTPLYPIQGYCELLLDGTLGGLTKDQKDKVQVIYDSALSLSQLTQDILDIHKLELGRLKLEISNVRAEEVVEHSVKRFQPVAEERHIKLVGSAEEMTLKCDSERIIQVLSNLIGNAVKFTTENKGIIEVYGKRHNGSALFIVKDNGIGIAKEQQQSLFTKFYQIDSSWQRSGGGTGLGLAICKGIVEAHNGKIWVESEVGKGTTVYFSIPSGGENR